MTVTDGKAAVKINLIKYILSGTQQFFTIPQYSPSKGTVNKFYFPLLMPAFTHNTITLNNLLKREWSLVSRGNQKLF